MTGIERLRRLARDMRDSGWQRMHDDLTEIADKIEREASAETVRADDSEGLYEENEGLRDMLNQVAWHLGLGDEVHYYSGDNYAACQSRVLDAIDGLTKREADVETVRSDAMEAWRWVCEHGGLATLELHEETFADLMRQRDEYRAIARGYERDATWVRDHGGLNAVNEVWNNRSNLKRMYESERAKVERQQRHIEFVQGKCRERQGHIVDLNKMVEELRKRAMPEGYEWTRYDTGEPVRIGGAIADELGRAHEVTSVEIFEDAAALHWNPDEPEERVWVGHGDCVRRPAVPAADGEPLEAGQTVYGIGRSQHEFRVLQLNDPRPETGERFSVRCFDKDENEECWCDPRLLTHTKPEPPKRLCRDCRHWQGDPSASHMGVCFKSFRERCCVDSYAAQLDYADACKDFEERGE